VRVLVEGKKIEKILNKSREGSRGNKNKNFEGGQPN
jgi:hypothetical protein